MYLKANAVGIVHFLCQIASHLIANAKMLLSVGCQEAYAREDALSSLASLMIIDNTHVRLNWSSLDEQWSTQNPYSIQMRTWIERMSSKLVQCAVRVLGVDWITIVSGQQVTYFSWCCWCAASVCSFFPFCVLIQIHAPIQSRAHSHFYYY